MMPYCLDFCDINATSVAITGGKGANLAILKQAGFDVPPGFILSTRAFSEFLSTNALVQEIDGALNSIRGIDAIQIRFTSKKILNLLNKTTIPAEVVSAVRKSKHENNYQSVAIRSSATAEDLPFASFAGQQDSFLNISNEVDILEKIKLCWFSLYNERSITYRLQNKIEHASVKMAVVIQEMVPADRSGILFTADPISNHHRHLVINAGYGLGEGLVMGWVNPDQIRVDKKNRKIISYQIGDKRKQVNYQDGGGTAVVEVSPDIPLAPTLTSDQVKQLAKLGMQVESLYRQPQDIEWAIRADDIYLLQSRPITSLYPIPSPRPDDKDLHIYFSIGHVQMITDPISPMGISLLSLLLPFGRPPRQVGYAPLIMQAGGRIFADITPLLNSKRGRDLIPKALQAAEPVSAVQIKHLLASEEFSQRNTNPSHKVSGQVIIDWVGPLLVRSISWLLFRNPTNASAETLAKGKNYLDSFAIKLSETDIMDKLAVIKTSTGDLFYRRLVWMMGMVAGGQVARIMLERLLKRKNLQLNLQALQSGLEGNITTEMDLLVGDLADIVSQEKSLQQILQDIVEQNLEYSPGLFQDFPEFERAWKIFIHRFGMRCTGELDISRPRWETEPQMIFQTILAKTKTSEFGSHRQHYLRLQEQNLALQNEILTALSSSLKGRLQRPLVKRLLKVALNLMPIREHPKYIISGYLNILRDQIRLVYAKLLSQGVSLPEDGVWYLTFDELQNLTTDPSTDFSEIIAERKLLYQHYRKLSPPRVITSEGEISHQSLSKEGFPPHAIVGSPVSAGVVEGLARVILDPAQEQLQPGEILVAPFTDPGWTPLFINAAGIALETGGLMTHGSVVAREYGIPAVVGIVEVTKKIKTGMCIRINGDQGFVEILSDELDCSM